MRDGRREGGRERESSSNTMELASFTMENQKLCFLWVQRFKCYFHISFSSVCTIFESNPQGMSWLYVFSQLAICSELVSSSPLFLYSLVEVFFSVPPPVYFLCTLRFIFCYIRMHRGLSKSSLPLDIVNKVLLENGHTHSLTNGLCPLLQQQSRVVEAETNMTCKAENVHCLALYKNSFPTPGI